MNEDEDGNIEVGRITIIRVVSPDGDILDAIWAEESNGDEMGLSEALGMMRLAEDTLIRDRMGHGGDQ